MRHRRWTAALDVGEQRKAPTEFRIWQAGENMTDFGPSLFTERSARDVMAEYERRGNKLSFDFEHLSVPENRKTDEPWIGAGYFEIEVRKSAAGPELWATRIEWSQEAQRQIEHGERRYFSPDYFQDEKTNEIVRLNKIALCTDPATHRLNLLASVRGGKKRTAVDEDEKDKDEKVTASDSGDPKAMTLALLLELLETADEAMKPKIREAIMLLGKGDDMPTPVSTAEPMVEPGPGQAQAQARKAARPASAPVADEALNRRLAALERRLDTEASVRLVEANRDLIPETAPALELWALKQSPETLSGWIKAQRATKPRLAAAGGHQEAQRKPAGAGAAGEEEFNPEAIQLTAADRAVLKRTGGNAAAYLTHKRQLAARKAGVDWEPQKAN